MSRIFPINIFIIVPFGKMDVKNFENFSRFDNFLMELYIFELQFVFSREKNNEEVDIQFYIKFKDIKDKNRLKRSN